jgi:hypothetical protein
MLRNIGVNLITFFNTRDHFRAAEKYLQFPNGLAKKSIGTLFFTRD